MPLRSVSRETTERLEHYLALLKKWQKAINLVGPKTLQDARSRHFIDSAQLSAHIPQNTKIADLGSGAGFPGLVLAMIRPDLDVSLVESDQRKAQFLKTVSRETHTAVNIHNERVENIIENIAPDIITARALSSLKELLDYTAPCLIASPDIKMVLLKGRQVDQEIDEAQKFYSFDFEKSPSITDPASCVLSITHIKSP